jgi:hypothetical protein
MLRSESPLFDRSRELFTLCNLHRVSNYLPPNLGRFKCKQSCPQSLPITSRRSIDGRNLSELHVAQM